jgi:hypothetical protein
MTSAESKTTRLRTYLILIRGLSLALGGGRGASLPFRSMRLPFCSWLGRAPRPSSRSQGTIHDD